MDPRWFIGISVSIALVGFASGQLEECKNGKTTFIVLPEREATALVIKTESTFSLSECIRLCQQASGCRAVNFRHNIQTTVPSSGSGGAQCEMLGSAVGAKSDITDLRRTARSIYYAERICLSAFDSSVSCNGRAWVAEWVPGTDLSDPADLIERIPGASSREDCITACIEHTDCRAALFHRTTANCGLSLISSYSVRDVDKWFRTEPNMDMYDNNCRTEPSDQCHFLQRRGEGMTAIFDKQIQSVQSSDRCKQSCLSERELICRSYTHDSELGVCYLSHRPIMAALPAQTAPLERRQGLQMGDLDDCISFDLKCKSDQMLVHAESRRIFDGRISSKSHHDSFTCGRTVEHSFHFETSISYDECGTTKEDRGKYSNLIFVKYGGGRLITFRDRLMKLICRIVTEDDVRVSYHMTVANTSIGDALVVHGTLPDVPLFKLNVLREDGSPAGRVSVGDEGYLEIQLLTAGEQDVAVDGIQVTNIIAYDKESRSRVELYDEKGCPTDVDIAGPLLQVSPSKLRAKIRFFGFQDSDAVMYKGLVKPCYGKCAELCPKFGLTKNRRLKRASRLLVPTMASRGSVPTLTDEQYEIKSGVEVTMQLKESDYYLDSNGLVKIGNITKEPVPSSPTLLTMETCFQNSAFCAASVVFVLAQAITLLVCIFVIKKRTIRSGHLSSKKSVTSNTFTFPSSDPN